MVESIFSNASLPSSASSTSQFLPQVKEQAENAIASVLAKNTEVSNIIVRGVGKLGEQGVEKLMARSLKQFSSAIKPTLDRPELKECFSFLERRASSIACKIRKTVQSNNNEVPETSALGALLEKNHRSRATPTPDIEQWLGNRGPEYIDPGRISPDRNTNQLLDFEPDAFEEPISEPDAFDEPTPLGERLIKEISQYLASAEVSSSFVSAVKQNFIKVRLSCPPM
jgi:hypothetical protein